MFIRGAKRHPLAGRKKGSQNKFTTFRAAAEQSFANQGGYAYLDRVAKSDPAAFLNFVGRFIPKQIDIDINIHDFRAKLEAARERNSLPAKGTSD